MRHMFHIEGVTDEQKTLDSARDKSRGDQRDVPEPVEVHYHKKDEFCSGKPHLIFKEGYARQPGSGPQ